MQLLHCEKILGSVEFADCQGKRKTSGAHGQFIKSNVVQKD